MNTITATVELGNGWELDVEIDVEEFEPGSPGKLYGPWEDSYPAEGAYLALGTIRASGDLEELGIVEGQEIHPAFLLGGRKALRKLEDEGAEQFAQDLADEAEAGWADYYADQDDYDEDDYDF